MAGPSQVTVEIATTSSVISKWNAPPTLPKITMNGNPFPAPKPPSFATGWQLVVLDSSRDMTDPASVRINTYFPLFADSSGYWSDTYVWTYDNLGRYLLAAGDPDTRLVFLASYGWDQNAPPTAFMLQLILGLGGGALAQKWATGSDRGSEVGWTSFPASYALIGGSSYEYGQGYEGFTPAGSGSANVQVSATLTNP